MHGGCVHARANPHHQHGRAIGLRPCNHGAQILRRNMAQRMALRLQIIQNRAAHSPRGRLQQRGVNCPIQIGHHRHTAAHRACGGHANAINCAHARLLHIGAQHIAQTRKIGIAKAGNAVRAHLRAIGQRHAGVGSANIGKQGKGGHGSILLTRTVAPSYQRRPQTQAGGFHFGKNSE